MQIKKIFYGLLALFLFCGFLSFSSEIYQGVENGRMKVIVSLKRERTRSPKDIVRPYFLRETEPDAYSRVLSYNIFVDIMMLVGAINFFRKFREADTINW